jgi:hypothetical protein
MADTKFVYQLEDLINTVILSYLQLELKVFWWCDESFKISLKCYGRENEGCAILSDNVLVIESAVAESSELFAIIHLDVGANVPSWLYIQHLSFILS